MLVYENLLSNIIISDEKLVIVKDELGQEKISHKFITKMLTEQGEEKNIKVLPVNAELSNINSMYKFICECSELPSLGPQYWNVLLPNLSDFLSYQKDSKIFEFISDLKGCKNIARIFMWVSIPHISHVHFQYVLAALEYMADTVLHFITDTEISLMQRRRGGGGTFKQYLYFRSKYEIHVKLKKKEVAGMSQLDSGSTEKHPLTFKIDLEETEMMARNAIKLPYEKVAETAESKIIYTPDISDDFDEEDPDEDLNI